MTCEAEWQYVAASVVRFFLIKWCNFIHRLQ